MHTTCGTLNYIAPEIVKNTGYDGYMADIWATGVILYFMLTGKRPFDDESVHKLLDKIIIGDYKFPHPEEKKTISEDAKDLIRNILNPNTRKRYNMEMIKCHRWFLAGLDEEDELASELQDENWSASEIQQHNVEEISNVGGVISQTISPSNRELSPMKNHHEIH